MLFDVLSFFLKKNSKLQTTPGTFKAYTKALKVTKELIIAWRVAAIKKKKIPNEQEGVEPQLMGIQIISNVQ